MKVVKRIGSDGRCTCSCGDPCPLGRAGSALRCTKEELEAAGVVTIPLDLKIEKNFVSGCCEGEKCFCGKQASKKVEETIFHDDPHQDRHPYTCYLCEEHFNMIMNIR